MSTFSRASKLLQRSSGVIPTVNRSFSTVPKTHSVLCFNGDGIGPEIVESAKKVIDAAGVSMDYVNMDVGFEANQRTGKFIAEEHLQAFDDLKIIFKGPLTIPPSATNTYVEIRDRKFTSANQVLRKVFDLYANIRPAKSLEGVKSRFENVDLVIVRENTEDVYTGEERYVDADTVEGIKRITRKASTRIAQTAFEYATANNRSLVTSAHKANVCKQADSLFLECCQAIAAEYPAIQYKEHLADSLLTALVQEPNDFDVLLCPNLYGDLISDLAAGLTGSLGLMPSGQFGYEHVLFEPAHGSAPDIAGQGIVNPISMVRCGVMMLQHLNENEAAARIDAAVNAVVREGQFVTADLGGSASTSEMTDAIIRSLK